MSINISKLDYLVIHSGYENRLFDYIDEINHKLIDRELSVLSFIKYNDQNFRFNEDQNDLDISKEIYSGLGFRIESVMDAMNIVSIIQEFEHCGCFDFTTMTNIEFKVITNKKVLFLSFDTESG